MNKTLFLFAAIMFSLCGCVSAPTNTETPSQVEYVAALGIIPGFGDASTEEIAATLARDIASPITFHGEVLDEQGQPLEDVPVLAVLLNRQLDPLVPPYYGWTFLTDIVSDEKGFFSIEDATGAGIAVSVSKQGYWDESALERHYYYAARLKNLNTFELPITKDMPAVFNLRKKPDEAFFESFNTGAIVLPDGEQRGINLLSPRYAVSLSDSDIIVQLSKTITGDAGNYAWSVTVSTDGARGGFQKVEGDLGFSAPEAGYMTEITLEAPRRGAEVLHRGEWNLYVKTAKAQYALLTIKARMLGTPFISIEGSLNTKGARYVR